MAGVDVQVREEMQSVNRCVLLPFMEGEELSARVAGVDVPVLQKPARVLTRPWLFEMDECIHGRAHVSARAKVRTRRFGLNGVFPPRPLIP